MQKAVEAIEAVSSGKDWSWEETGQRLVSAAEGLSSFAIRNLDPEHMPLALKLAEAAANMGHAMICTERTVAATARSAAGEGKADG